jgi:hypothetical protein
MVNDIGGLACILGYRVSSLLMKDLALPLGASYKAKSIRNDILEKMEHSLANWKMFFLSKGGGSN